SREFSLCAWLFAGLSVCLSLTKPTFVHYFVLVVPFLAVLATLGGYAIGSRIWAPRRPTWIVALIVGFTAVAPAKLLYYNEVYRNRCKTVEQIAQLVDRVTPEKGLIFAEDEAIYFAAHRLPPPGLENSHHGLLSPPPGASTLLTSSQLNEWLRTGHF